MADSGAPLLGGKGTATAHIRIQATGLSPAKEVLKTPRQMQPRWLDRWYWPLVLVASVLLAMCTQAVMRRGGGPAAGATGVRMQQQRKLTLFEEQLMGCRTLKSHPLPYVDTNASLRVLDAHTPEQQSVAQRYTDALSACADFACLRRANALERAPGQFRFPHYMVVGFPKCATTSIYCHLIQHPQVQYARNKESHMLVDECGGNLATCAPGVQWRYLEMLNLGEAAGAQFTKAAFDGSTHYAAEAGWLAPQLAAEFPWLRVVVSLRDPISQALAMFLHNLVHNRSAPCWDDNGQRAYTCVLESLEESKRARYGVPLADWAKAFSPGQLHIVQYESITNKGSMPGDLKALKTFLELDPRLPSDKLPLTNWKHMRGDDNSVGRYWNMTRTEYQHVVEVARRNTQEVVEVLGRHGYDRDARVAWVRNWERVWKGNLDNNCEGGAQGNCRIVVS